MDGWLTVVVQRLERIIYITPSVIRLKICMETSLKDVLKYLVNNFTLQKKTTKYLEKQISRFRISVI